MILFITSLQSTFLSTKTPLEEQILENKSPYQVNENGQTYGHDIHSLDTIIEPPDLMAAIGVDGTFGYILTSDLYSDSPKTPEEALERQKNRKSPIFIPLYESDGKTIIGEFQMGN